MVTEDVCEVRWLGRLDYARAWQMQADLADEIAAGQRPPTLLLLEHPHTYTIGRRGGLDHLVWDEAERKKRGVTVFEVDRGGDITYHGPGQLVGYPLIPLARPGWQGERLPQADFVGYVRKLEKALIFALARFGIPGAQRNGLSGVWVMAEAMGRCPRCDPRLRPEPGKIASVGVKVDARGVSRHGFALNVQPDMSYWEGIIACGLDGVQMLAMSDLLTDVPEVERAAEVVAETFGEVFGCPIRRLTTV
jgi:lipoate-protein ligase B